MRRFMLISLLLAFAAISWAADSPPILDYTEPNGADAKRAAQEKLTLGILDTHTHFYDPTRPQGVPWPGKNDKRLYRPVLPDEFKQLSKPFGVAGTIVVEASPWVEDNQWLLDLAAKDPFIVGVIGRLDPASNDFEKNLRRFTSNPLYRGIRISHNELKSGLKGNLVERLKLLVELNLALDVNGGPDMPADVTQLAAKVPKLRIVINHAANLRIDGKEPPRIWRDGMARTTESRSNRVGTTSDSNGGVTSSSANTAARVSHADKFSMVADPKNPWLSDPCGSASMTRTRMPRMAKCPAK